MADALRAPAPPLTPFAALARVADAESLVLLAGGGDGATVLAWDARCGSVDGDALARLERSLPPRARTDDARAGWLMPQPGDVALQLDYEFPRRPGRCWRLDRFVAWDRDGAATLHALDAVGLDALRAGLARPPRPLPAPTLRAGLRPAWDAAGHRERVARIRALIAAGDFYQLNLTLPFTGELAPQAAADAALALRLIGASPAPYAALLRGGGPSVVSHSPERFLRVVGDAVESAPIKGTRRRVAGEEARVRAELLASPKERAELAMIVDLVRNDLGRVCAPGSVRVAAAAELLDLPYVHHLVGRVRGRLRAGGAAAAIAAAFPAGSITGCPKLRTMAAITGELEVAPRGPYCGAFGWLGRDACDLAVAIRTIVVEGERVRVHAGGGITADSDPLAEWDEVRAKAAAMAAALGATV